MTEKYLKVSEVAQKLNIKQRSIYGYIESGQLEAFRFGKKNIRVSETAIEDFLKRKKIIINS